MDDFLILLQAKLDEAKSKGNINSDIEKIQDQIDKLKLKAEIDSKSISNITKQLESVIGEKITIGLSANIDTNAINQIKKTSDSATNTVVQNEKKKQEAYKATSDAVVYHAGVISKLNKAETNGRFYGSNRGTGYFGTGHYFVDSATKHELDNNSSYSKLPYTSVDISQYDNLFRANNDKIAGKLHDFLENITKFTQGSDRFNIDELFSQFKNVFTDTTMDIKDFGYKMEQLKTFMSTSDLSDRRDSVSTQFMKSLGYGGVDTRGTKYADTRYGTVIYDLKEESVLQANITDELQKQGQMLEKINYEKGQVFDSSTDAKIQEQIDAQQRAAEVQAEFHKIFDTTELDKTDSELSKVQNRLSEINTIISDCESSIESLEEDKRRFAKEMEDFDLFMSEEEIQEDIKNSRKDYQDRIEELSLERVEFEKRIPILEETCDKEYKLANEAYSQAEQIVEQRRLESQQSSSTTNKVIQNEEKKQQAIQESIKLQSELASFNAKFKETGIATINEDGVVDMKKSLEEVRNIYSDFGKVTIKNEMSDLVKGTEQFRVSIESSNGELKRTESFLMKLSEDGKSFVFADDMIRSSESTVRHLNEQQEATNKIILKDEKLANAMGDVREKSEQIRQAEEKRQQLAQNKVINKALEDEYKQRQKLANQVNEIQLSIGNGDYDTQILSYKTALQKLGLSTVEVTEKMKNVSVAFEELKTSASGDNIISDDIITKAKTLETEMSKLDNTVKQIKLKDSLQADDLQVEQTIIRLNKQLIANGKYAGETKSKIRQMIAELEKGNVASARLKQINVEAKELHSNMVAINKAGQGFWNRIVSKINSLGTYLSAAAVISKVLSSAKNGISTVRELDTALVDLKKTTSMTNRELEEFYYASNDVAKQMGVTTKEIINQASAWSRLGFSSAEAATKMAQLSSKFASISPGMSVDEAQEGLVSIIKAWGLDIDQVEREVLDNINTLGNKFAESNADLVAGMKRSAAALSATGTTYQDAFALFTGAQEVVQNAEVTGRALRSISMRIHGYSEDSEDGLEVLDEELKNITGDLIDLTKTAEHSQGISIFKEGSSTEFKSLVNYFGEINEIWDEMSHVQQNAFLDKAFGKNQAQAGAAIIQNYEAISDAIKAMEDASGSAEREMSIIMDSLDYKLNRLSETGTGIAQNLFQRDDMKKVVDSITTVAEAVDFLTDKLGLFGSLAAGAGLFAGFKNIGKCRISVRIS